MKRNKREERWWRTDAYLAEIKRMQELVARSKVAVKRLPVGAHLGWRPSWLEPSLPLTR